MQKHGPAPGGQHSNKTPRARIFTLLLHVLFFLFRFAGGVAGGDHGSTPSSTLFLTTPTRRVGGGGDAEAALGG